MLIFGLSDITIIGIIVTVLSTGFGLYMRIKKKPGFVRRIKDDATYKDAENYSIKGGLLLLLFAVGCFVMTVVSFFSTGIANIIGIVALVVFAYFWKKMSDEYGPI